MGSNGRLEEEIPPFFLRLFPARPKAPPPIFAEIMGNEGTLRFWAGAERGRGYGGGQEDIFHFSLGTKPCRRRRRRHRQLAKKWRIGRAS